MSNGIKRTSRLRNLRRGTVGANTSGVCVRSLAGRFLRSFIFPYMRTNTLCRSCVLNATFTHPVVTGEVIRVTGTRNTSTVYRNYANGNGSRIHFRLTVGT